MAHGNLLEGRTGNDGPEVTDTTKITDPELLAPIEAALPEGARLKTMVAVNGSDRGGHFNEERVQIQAPTSIKDAVVRAMLPLGLQLSSGGNLEPNNGEVINLTFINRVRRGTAEQAISVVDSPEV